MTENTIQSDEADLSDLHPITNICGTVGPVLAGGFGMIMLTLFIAPIQTPTSLFELARNITLFGIGLFIFGALTIPIQTRYTLES